MKQVAVSERRRSKADDWAKRQPKELNLCQRGSPYAVNVFLIIHDGVPGMRIDNSGPFGKGESLRLARWIFDTFGEPR